MPRNRRADLLGLNSKPVAQSFQSPRRYKMPPEFGLSRRSKISGGSIASSPTELNKIPLNLRFGSIRVTTFQLSPGRYWVQGYVQPYSRQESTFFLLK